jgi:hypothetical protein
MIDIDKKKFSGRVKQTNKHMNKENNATNKNNRKNKQWLRNRDQRKNPKLFNVQMIQLPNGRFHLLGKGSFVQIKKNGVSSDWHSVDVRDLACEMRLNGISTF